jgi:hypothetical protein
VALWSKQSNSQNSLVNLPDLTRQETQEAMKFSQIVLPNRARGLAFGMTDSGKSVLTYHLMQDWLRRYPATARVLIVDSKPNYIAQWKLNGTSAKSLYKRQEKDNPVPDSVVLPLQRHGELAQVWRQGHQIAIAQIPSLQYIGSLEAIMDEFYNKADAKYHQLALVDEGADFFSSSGAYRRAHSLMQIVRSGRKRGVSLLFCSQEPRHLPSGIISQRTNAYVFMQGHEADRKRLEEGGMPIGFPIPTRQHEFYYHSRNQPELVGTYKLKLPEAA